MKNLILLLPLLFNSSCSSKLKNQCLGQDWLAYGRDLGASGADLDSSDLPDRCSKEGFSPNLKLIDQGYQAGLQTHCQPTHFFQAAKTGEELKRNNCPNEQRQELKVMSEKGLRLHCTKEGAIARANTGKLSASSLCPNKYQPLYEQHFDDTARSYLRKSIITQRGEWQKNQLLISQIDSRLSYLGDDINKAKIRESRPEKNKNNLTKVLDLVSTSSLDYESDRNSAISERDQLMQRQLILNQELTSNETRLVEVEERIEKRTSK